MLRAVGIALAGLALVVAFALFLFPWERLAPTVARQLSAAAGAEVALADVGLGVSLGGPVIEAEGVRVDWPDASLTLDHLRVRPAWSFSWFQGDPALHVDAAGSPGAIEGTVYVSGGFDGRVEGLDLTALPPAWLPGGEAPLAGALDGDIDLSRGPAGPVGTLAIDGSNGAIALATLPVAIPYDTLKGRFEADEAGRLTVEALHLEGPMLSVDVEGSVDGLARLASAPLDLRVVLRDVDPSFRSSLAAFGMALDGSGATELQISGTPSRPVVR